MPRILKTKIYIPTLNRVGENRQVTLREFLTKSKYVPYLVSSPEEVNAHKQYHDNVIGCPENGKNGIGKTRQWILENSDADIIIMIDDDMKFQYRPEASSTKLEQATELNSMIQACVKAVSQGYIHGGVSTRQGNNHVVESTKINTRCGGFHFLARKEVIQVGARFDKLLIMEDFYFTLSLLTKGYPNLMIFSHCFNQVPGSIGGCNTYRTLELQKKAAEELHKQFPEFVKVVKKVAKTDWSIAKGERTDVIIQWAKAHKHGLAKRKTP